MTTTSLPRTALVTTVVVAIIGVVLSGPLVAQRLAGDGGFVTDPLAIVATAAAALAAEVARMRLTAAGNARAARLAAALAASLLFSLLAGWVAVASSSAPGPLASLAVAVWSIAWIPPLALSQLTASAAVRADDRSSWIHAVVIAASALAMLSGIVLWHPTDPFTGVASIAPEGWPTSFSAIGDVITVLAIAALLLLPVTLARAAAGSSGFARARLGVAAVGTAAAPLVVVFCVLLAVARNPGDVDPTAGSVAFLVAVAGGAATGPLCALLVARGRIGASTLAFAVRGIAFAVGALVVVGIGTIVVAGGGSPTLSALLVAGLAVAVSALAWWGGGRLATTLAVPSTRVPVTVDELTAREGEVLALLAEGASNAGIAAQLVVSERTVDAHLRAVFTKLDLQPDPGANRRVQAARHWLERVDSAR